MVVDHLSHIYKETISDNPIDTMKVPQHKIPAAIYCIRSVDYLEISFVDFFLEVAGSNGQSEITDTALS